MERTRTASSWARCRIPDGSTSTGSFGSTCRNGTSTRAMSSRGVPMSCTLSRAPRITRSTWISCHSGGMSDPFDPRDPEFVADPYPVFHELRARGELLRHDGLGLYLTLSHSAASAVLRHRGLGRMWTDAA